MYTLHMIIITVYILLRNFPMKSFKFFQKLFVIFLILKQSLPLAGKSACRISLPPSWILKHPSSFALLPTCNRTSAVRACSAFSMTCVAKSSSGKMRHSSGGYRILSEKLFFIFCRIILIHSAEHNFLLNLHISLPDVRLCDNILYRLDQSDVFCLKPRNIRF